MLGEVLLLLSHREQCRISAPLPLLLCLKSRRGWQGRCGKERGQQITSPPASLAALLLGTLRSHLNLPK